EQRGKRVAAVAHLGRARLAIARYALGAVRMPRERIPQHDFVGRASALDLAPDHRRAPFPLRLRGRPGARHGEPTMRDEIRLVQQLEFGAERDAGEAAAAMARSLAEQQHARAQTPRFEISGHVLAAHARRLAPRRAVTLVAIAPWIEHTRRVR